MNSSVFPALVIPFLEKWPAWFRASLAFFWRSLYFASPISYDFPVSFSVVLMEFPQVVLFRDPVLQVSLLWVLSMGSFRDREGESFLFNSLSSPFLPDRTSPKIFLLNAGPKMSLRIPTIAWPSFPVYEFIIFFYARADFSFPEIFVNWFRSALSSGLAPSEGFSPLLALR